MLFHCPSVITVAASDPVPSSPLKICPPTSHNPSEKGTRKEMPNSNTAAESQMPAPLTQRPAPLPDQAFLVVSPPAVTLPALGPK